MGRDGWNAGGLRDGSNPGVRDLSSCHKSGPFPINILGDVQKVMLLLLPLKETLISQKGKVPDINALAESL